MLHDTRFRKSLCKVRHSRRYKGSSMAPVMAFPALHNQISYQFCTAAVEWRLGYLSMKWTVMCVYLKSHEIAWKGECRPDFAHPHHISGHGYRGSCQDITRRLKKQWLSARMGAVVAERIDCLPPTNRIGFNSPAGSQVGIVPDDAAGRRVFSDISLYPALEFRRCSILTSFPTHMFSRQLSVSPKVNRVRFLTGPLLDFRIVVIIPDDGAGRQVFSEICRFSRTCILTLLHIDLASLASVLKTSFLIVAQTSLFTPLYTTEEFVTSVVKKAHLHAAEGNDKPSYVVFLDTTRLTPPRRYMELPQDLRLIAEQLPFLFPKLFNFGLRNENPQFDYAGDIGKMGLRVADSRLSRPLEKLPFILLCQWLEGEFVLGHDNHTSFLLSTDNTGRRLILVIDARRNSGAAVLSQMEHVYETFPSFMACRAVQRSLPRTASFSCVCGFISVIAIEVCYSSPKCINVPDDIGWLHMGTVREGYSFQESASAVPYTTPSQPSGQVHVAKWGMLSVGTTRTDSIAVGSGACSVTAGSAVATAANRGLINQLSREVGGASRRPRARLVDVGAWFGRARLPSLQLAVLLFAETFSAEFMAACLYIAVTNISLRNVPRYVRKDSERASEAMRIKERFTVRQARTQSIVSFYRLETCSGITGGPYYNPHSMFAMPASIHIPASRGEKTQRYGYLIATIFFWVKEKGGLVALWGWTVSKGWFKGWMGVELHRPSGPPRPAHAPATEYTTCIRVDVKQGFQKCSVYCGQSIVAYLEDISYDGNVFSRVDDRVNPVRLRVCNWLCTQVRESADSRRCNA
ncbi:hypothetical protein PR048_002457 [Dryococelus australis]|uniref:Uncharacterized protein n=1 Tax=Dryococelus australis TaxID=614101 RepID=A0ABQ9ILA6_9NEOP|nr:hypothetical protein PR048_002457 [Dryococelus australis]